MTALANYLAMQSVSKLTNSTTGTSAINSQQQQQQQQHNPMVRNKIANNPALAAAKEKRLAQLREEARLLKQKWADDAAAKQPK